MDNSEVKDWDYMRFQVFIDDRCAQESRREVDDQADE